MTVPISAAAPPPAVTKADSGTRVPELDGLRGFAMLLVLLAHYLGYVTLIPHGTAGFVNGLIQTFSAGLDLFFLLSGFLVAGILMDHRDSPRYFRAFFIRRAYRVLPPYYLWICSFLLARAMHLGSSLPALVNSRIPAWSYFLFFQNYFFSAKKTLGPMWLNVTWSLSIEEQFYIFLPLLIWILPRKWLAAVIGALVVAAPLLRAYVMSYPRAVFLPYRADSLGLGVLLAIVLRNRRASSILLSRGWPIAGFGLALAAGLAILIRYPHVMVTWGMTWTALLCCAALSLCVVKKEWMSVFKAWPLRRLGRISYSVYLIHYPVNILLHWVLLREDVAIHSWTSAAVSVLAFVLVIAIASASWKWIEKPFLIKGAQFQF